MLQNPTSPTPASDDSSTVAPRSSLLPHPRRLVAFGPHHGAHRVAVRAGLAVAIPLLSLYFSGHIDLALYAVFGAFTALYGRTHTHLTRLRMQAAAGGALVLAVVIGTAISVSPEREWIVIPVAAAVAGLATFLSDALDWHPPGALFFVFALAACASVPSDPRRIIVALLLAAGSALVAMVISTAGLARRRARGSVSTARAVSFSATAARAGEFTRVAVVAVAIGVAGLIPTLTGLGHPYWAMVAAAATLAGADAASLIVRAGHRVLGTVLGVVLAAALFTASSTPIVLIVFVVLLQAAAELFVGRNYGLTVVFVTPLALIMSELAHPADYVGVIVDRTLETFLGAAVGLAAALAATALAALTASRASETAARRRSTRHSRNRAR